MDRLKKLRTERGLLQSDVANFLNIKTNSYSQWETGKREPDFSSLLKLADYFQVSLDYLLGRTDDLTSDGETLLPGLYPVTKKKFPVLGKVSCGEPVYTEEDRETSIMASADIDADFCLVAKGDSMTGASIEDGDIVFIKKMEIVPNNYIGVVLVGDEATLKYVDWRPESSTLILTPANPAYRTQIYQGADLDQIRIIGLAVTLQKSLVHRIKIKKPSRMGDLARRKYGITPALLLFLAPLLYRACSIRSPRIRLQDCWAAFDHERRPLSRGKAAGYARRSRGICSHP